ncbi:STN and carboxypeptidase regulatory-like domain-containing protein [Algoriphagus sp.]|uniref:STN and carboxypeptidase regulatory-like domain-containing protein n=1 Tax=Algoriphagus sp. TaxID=1872435 RepID=UPI0025F0988F|nr:STN and carboxypeptidase regulatory-like domain-containing protein [Algoriphagus sp.]
MRKHFFRYVFTILLIIGGIQIGIAQQFSLLEKKVSMHAQEEPLDAFLNRLSKEVGGVFSYSPSSVDINRRISGNFQDQSCREVLEEVFEGSINYKQKGVYLILTPAPPSEKEITISGYVVDEQSGERIKNATVYNPITLQSSTTDEFGYFQFQVKNPAEDNFELVVNKKDYADTLLVEGKSSRFRKIFLKAEGEETSPIVRSLTEPMKNFWAWTSNSVGFTNFENIQDTLSRGFQVSFVPFIGTNRKISGSVQNDFSINILGGFSGGTNKAEIGGLFNINRRNVQYFQAAGLFNQVGGTVKGFQVAGITNINLDRVEGFQAAGVGNFSSGPVSGVQSAGVLNIVTSDIKGVQLAGVTNYTHHDVHGGQISGVLNIARNVKGFQLGLLNYSDSTSGTPIGLISFVRKGYHKVEIGTDEILPLNISLRTGTRGFYNMIFAGIRPEKADSVTWAFGYGVGTSPKLMNRLYLNFELSSQQLLKGNLAALNLINRGYLGLDYQFSNKVGIFAGPSINLRVYDSSYTEHPDLFSSSGPKIISEKDYQENIKSQLWWGFRAGIRFF